jgi:hypothetical protein
MVRKADWTWRPCGDFRRLNMVTVANSYPLPNMLDFAGNAAGCTIFSKIDLRKGYHQILVHPAYIQETAITTPFGCFEYLRMPFGLMNAGATLERKVDRAVADLEAVLAYVDDKDVASRNAEEHAIHLCQLFTRLREHRLVINVEKCVFGASSIPFLGHHLLAERVKPLPENVAAVTDFPRPSTVKELQMFLGMVNFYHGFLPGATRALKPLTDCLHGGPKGPTAVEWNGEREVAFTEVKQMLTSATRLAHPAQAAKLSLAVDASSTHIGACLQQKRAGSPGLELLGFFSKKLEPAQVKYSAFDRELLACFLGIRHFRYMLEARLFTIYTVQKPLTTAINRASDPWMARQCHQLAFVAEYTSDIPHIAGTSNVVADTLSWQPVPLSPSPAAACVKAPSGSQAAARQEGKSNSSSPSVVASVVAHAPLGSVDYAAMADAQGCCPEVQKVAASPALQVRRVQTHGADVLCDVSTGVARQLVPATFRSAVFTAIHGLAHPGIRATRHLVLSRFVWHGCASDVAGWCHDCQRGKVTRQPAAATQSIPVPERRFTHLHVDLVGLLPTSAEGFKYLFTIIDRSTRWVEAIRVKNMEVATIADALVAGWVSRFGVPAVITYSSTTASH